MAATRELLAKRRDRAIAIVLGVKEREIDQYLPPQVKAKLRKVILDQINDFYDFALDMAAEDDGVVMNDLYREKLEEIHARVTETYELVRQG